MDKLIIDINRDSLRRNFDRRHAISYIQHVSFAVVALTSTYDLDNSIDYGQRNIGSCKTDIGRSGFYSNETFIIIHVVQRICCRLVYSNRRILRILILQTNGIIGCICRYCPIAVTADGRSVIPGDRSVIGVQGQFDGVALDCRRELYFLIIVKIRPRRVDVNIRLALGARRIRPAGTGDGVFDFSVYSHIVTGGGQRTVDIDGAIGHNTDAVAQRSRAARGDQSDALADGDATVSIDSGALTVRCHRAGRDGQRARAYKGQRCFIAGDEDAGACVCAVDAGNGVFSRQVDDQRADLIAGENGGIIVSVTGIAVLIGFADRCAVQRQGMVFCVITDRTVAQHVRSVRTRHLRIADPQVVVGDGLLAALTNLVTTDVNPFVLAVDLRNDPTGALCPALGNRIKI